jgi:hypothetical protein
MTGWLRPVGQHLLDEGTAATTRRPTTLVGGRVVCLFVCFVCFVCFVLFVCLVELRLVK